MSRVHWQRLVQAAAAALASLLCGSCIDRVLISSDLEQKVDTGTEVSDAAISVQDSGTQAGETGGTTPVGTSTQTGVDTSTSTEGEQQRDTSCDKVEGPVKDPPRPCPPMLLLALTETGFACVVPATCETVESSVCSDEGLCPPGSECRPDFAPICDLFGCSEPYSVCIPAGCPLETELLCDCPRPACGEGRIALIQDGCWVCVDIGTCGNPQKTDPIC